MRKSINLSLIIGIIVIVAVFKGPHFLQSLNLLRDPSIVLREQEFDKQSAYNNCVAAGKSFATEPELAEFDDISDVTVSEIQNKKYDMTVGFSIATAFGGRKMVSILCEFKGANMESYILNN